MQTASAAGNAASTQTPMVVCRDLVFRRGGRRIFNGLSLEVPRGSITAIMGPSGSGKTTLLKLIGGVLRPHAGHVVVDGLEVARLPRVQLYRLRRRIGVLFQSGALLTDLSVLDNVALPLREHTELPRETVDDIALLKLEAVGLRGAAGLYPGQLSGGMARRVALARAIALDPGLVLYDEPFTGQDPIGLGTLVRLIRDLNGALGLTSVLVSHDVPETFSIADHVFVIGDGQLLGAGTPAELSNSDDPRIRQFLDGLADGPVPFHYPAEPLAAALALETP